MVADNRYGALMSTRTRIQFAMPPPDGYRCRPEFGGGIFFDASSYWLHVQAVCGLGDATGTGHSDFRGPNGVDSSVRSRLTWTDGREWVIIECRFDDQHIAEHEFVFERAVARLRHFLLPIAGPASLNLVVGGNDSTRVVLSFAPVAYYELQFGRMRELLTSGASDRDGESAAAERIHVMAALYADARRRLSKATG